jgi:hypothetical protein
MALRIALRFLIAVGLLLQGGIGATAVYAAGAGGHHCHAAANHDNPAPTCPCCPTKSLGMTCADACMTVAALPAFIPLFRLPLPTVSPSGETTPLVAASIAPPLRPPIA